MNERSWQNWHGRTLRRWALCNCLEWTNAHDDKERLCHRPVYAQIEKSNLSSVFPAAFNRVYIFAETTRSASKMCLNPTWRTKISDVNICWTINRFTAIRINRWVQEISTGWIFNCCVIREKSREIHRNPWKMRLSENTDRDIGQYARVRGHWMKDSHGFDYISKWYSSPQSFNETSNPINSSAHFEDIVVKIVDYWRSRPFAIFGVSR